MRLRYTPRARRQLDAISEYITERNPDAARRVGARIRETIDLLVAFPNIGHQGALAATREMVVPGLPYVSSIALKLERTHWSFSVCTTVPNFGRGKRGNSTPVLVVCNLGPA